jgi:CPA1 family monovalent cation:H+ antiporter
MHDVEFILVSLLVAVAGLGAVARAMDIPYPIVLVVGGLALGFVPGLPDIELAPELVLVIFLPPLLYSAAFFANLNDLRRNLRPIALNAIGLVLVTMCLVAVVVKALVPEMPWAAAFTLGAIVAPTDPVAATAIMRRMAVPRRIVSVVEGESLINDGTALVAYRTAVAAVGGTFSVWEAGMEFVLSAAGGVAIGVAAGWVIVQIRRRIDDIPVEITISLLSGFAGYVPAEAVGASGVLAAVTVGLYSGWRANDVLLAETRVKVQAFWHSLAFLLDSVLFVLVGLQLPRVLDALAPRPLDRYLLPALGIAVAVMAVRMGFVLLVAAVRTKLPRVEDALPRSQRIVVGWSGMRGALSLAAALAVPLEAAGGGPLGGRDLVVLVTFVTILVTIVVQGLTLPLLVRACGLERSTEEERREQEARLQAAEAALERLDHAGANDEAPDTTVERLRTTYTEHAERAAAELGDRDVETEDSSAAYAELRALTLAAERDAILRLRREGKLSNETARRLQHEIDLAESRLRA